MAEDSYVQRCSDLKGVSDHFLTCLFTQENEYDLLGAGEDGFIGEGDTEEHLNNGQVGFENADGEEGAAAAATDGEAMAQDGQQDGVKKASQPTSMAGQPNKVRMTTPYLTKYERARVLGTRALQIRSVICFRETVDLYRAHNLSFHIEYSAWVPRYSFPTTANQTRCK